MAPIHHLFIYFTDIGSEYQNQSCLLRVVDQNSKAILPIFGPWPFLLLGRP